MKLPTHGQRSFRFSLSVVAAAFLIQGACGGVKDSTGADPMGDNGSAGSGGSAGPAGQSGTAGAGAAGTTGSGGATGTGGTTGAAGAGGTTGAAGAGGATGAAGAGGAPPASGKFITINGTMVPKEKAVVFIHLGHSNMVGQALGPAALHGYFFDTQPRLWSYDGTKGTFKAATERTAPDNEGNAGGAGPGVALLKAAATLAGPDYHFISVARAQGSLPTTNWQKGGPLYSDLMNRAKGLAGKVTFGGIFVMLGVTDRHLLEKDWPGFPGRMAKIISDIRADLGEPNLPVLQCGYEVEATAVDINITTPFAKLMMPLFDKLPSSITNLAIVSAAGTGQQDDHHFNLSGHKTWADRAIMIMKDKGWFPWTN